MSFVFDYSLYNCFYSGDHLSGKPRNVREFNNSCQANVRNFTKSQGSVREKISSGRKNGLKLFIVSCIFESIQLFSRSLFSVKY